MPLPEVGNPVPDFSLNELQNGAAHRLSDVAARAPTLIAFFKRSCATSTMTLPFIERLHQHYPSLQLLGVSQDDEADTAAFAAQTGLTFPIVMDSDWKVSTEYDLFTVPSVFLLDTRRTLRRVNMGWSKEQYGALSDEIAQLLGVAPALLFTDADKVPVFKPG